MLGTKRAMKIPKRRRPICSTRGFKPERISLCYLTCILFFWYTNILLISHGFIPCPNNQIQGLNYHIRRPTLTAWLEASSMAGPPAMPQLAFMQQLNLSMVITLVDRTELRLENPCPIDVATWKGFFSCGQNHSPQRKWRVVPGSSWRWRFEDVLGTLAVNDFTAQVTTTHCCSILFYIDSNQGTYWFVSEWARRTYGITDPCIEYYGGCKQRGAPIHKKSHILFFVMLHLYFRIMLLTLYCVMSILSVSCVAAGGATDWQRGSLPQCCDVGCPSQGQGFECSSTSWSWCSGWRKRKWE